MATRFLGSEFQINVDGGGGYGITGAQLLPRLTTLSDGRFAVVYETVPGSTLGDIVNGDVIAAVFNADGSASSINFLNVFNSSVNQAEPDLAALPGGGFGVVFDNVAHADGSADPNPDNITYVRVSANGALGTPLAIGDFNFGGGHDYLFAPEIATLSTGRQVVVFENVFTQNVDNDIYLNVVSMDGTTTQFSAANPLTVENNTSWQDSPAVAAAGNTALVVYEDGTGETAGNTHISARLFDGASNTIGAVFTISNYVATHLELRVAALDDHRYVIVYGGSTLDEFGRIYDTSGGGSLSPEFMIDQPRGPGGVPVVAATADGGFIVTWSEHLAGGDFDVYARRFNSDGTAMGQQFIVNRLTGQDQEFSDVAVNGVNVFFAWTDKVPRPSDTSVTSVSGQVMTLTTPPDFNDNGVSDILWRSDGGQLALWDMNRTGAIAGSSFVGAGGVPITPDPSWSVAAISDFSGDGRSDVLWRSTSGQTALWTMNGSTITSSASLTTAGIAVNPDPSWSVTGVGDFNGDGASDILWRNTSGALALWSMNGAAIIGSGFVTAGGTAVNPDPSWSVAGIGDFNGDRMSDILWRNTSGGLALWTMNGSSIVGSAVVTSGGVAVAPDPSWTVAGVGDFDADGKADLLWRNSNGSLVAWLMNGSTIAGSGFVTVNGNAVAPDPSWHVVEIGDFNGDARTDILWRNDNGQVAEWLMKGTAITASFVPSAGGTSVSPDATWHIQGKPTDFA